MKTIKLLFILLLLPSICLAKTKKLDIEVLGIDFSNVDVVGATETKEHRDFIYSYRAGLQLIRGKKVLRDGYGTWYDVENIPANLDGFEKITDWSKVSAEHRAEKAKLEAILPKYDLYFKEYNGPKGTGKPVMKPGYKPYIKPIKKKTAHK